MKKLLKKVLAHLPNKDKMLAKAVKAIIYKEVKEKHKEMSGLDRAAEMMRVITKAKVDEVLKQKAEIQKVIDYLEHKQKIKSTEKKDDKKEEKKIKRPLPEFESSVGEVSSFDSVDSSRLSKSKKKKSRKIHKF